MEAEGINRSWNYILINPQQFSCHTSGRGGCYGYGRIKRRSKVTDWIRCFQIIRCSMWSDVTVHQMFRYMFRYSFWKWCTVQEQKWDPKKIYKILKIGVQKIKILWKWRSKSESYENVGQRSTPRCWPNLVKDLRQGANQTWSKICAKVLTKPGQRSAPRCWPNLVKDPRQGADQTWSKIRAKVLTKPGQRATPRCWPNLVKEPRQGADQTWSKSRTKVLTKPGQRAAPRCWPNLVKEPHPGADQTWLICLKYRCNRFLCQRGTQETDVLGETKYGSGYDFRLELWWCYDPCL